MLYSCHTKDRQHLHHTGTQREKQQYEARASSVLLLARAKRAPPLCGVNVGDLLCGTSIASIESTKSIESIGSVESSDSTESIESIQSIESIKS